jgi:large subunit ribosomal protein L32
MPQPKGHLAKGHQLRRRSHLALKASSLSTCSNCKKATRPHAVCRHCGSYKGKTVVDIVGKELAKQEKRKKRAQK